MARGRRHLLSLQEGDGHWCGELEGDSVLESEYSLLLWFLGRDDDPRLPKLAESVRRWQDDAGGWPIYPGGPADPSASVKAYFCLKLAGDDPESSHMRRARQAIESLGGVEATNSYTKIYLSIFGQYDWERCPAMPPEMVLLPDWFYFNIYEMSSWSRGIFVPLSVVWAHRPTVEVPEEKGLAELYRPEDELFGGEAHPGGGAPGRPPGVGPGRNGGVTDPRDLDRRWQHFFETADRWLKRMERGRPERLRRRALWAAEQWILERIPMSDGLGAIFPAIVNTVMALTCLDREPDDPAMASQLEALERHEVDRGDTLVVQPAMSPVWDTSQAVAALREAGLPADHEALQRAADWLLAREVTHVGDWKVKNPKGEPGGWYFEYENEFYPDCDDTAEVLLALGRVEAEEDGLQRRMDAARSRGFRWLYTMQNPDGGWASFDRECDREILTHVPFADHNAMIDPSCVDITGRVLTLMAEEGVEGADPRVRRAVEFLHERQEADGTWYGRWGSNYIYGTWLALEGLARAGDDMSAARYQRAADWLVSCQNDDGGWGETLGSYDDPTLKGEGPSTAAQTAWAVLGLVAAGRAESRAALRGVEYLLQEQGVDGSWEDVHWTGTGFPRVFYLRYYMYDDYFPLLALAGWREVTEERPPARSLSDRESRVAPRG